MADSKAINQKAQEILKSLEKKYDDNGNMTVEYFDSLEKGVLDYKRFWNKKKQPEQATTTPAAPEPPTPPVAAVAGAGEPPKKPEQAPPVPEAKPPQLPITETAPVDAVHQAKNVVVQPTAAQVPAKISNKEHALGKIKRLMEGGATDEKTGKVDVTPEQAAFTLNPLIQMFEQVQDDDVEILKLIEVAGDIAKDKAVNPETGVVNPLYSGRAVQVLKQSLVKNMRATEPARKQILSRYNTMIPFSEAEKRNDPVIEAMDRDFKEVFSTPMGDDVRLKLLGPEVAKRFLKYLDKDLMELNNKQLMTRAEAEPGATIKRKQPDGRMVSMPISEEEIRIAKHELRVRGVIQKVQNLLWDNFGITTYLGASMFGSGTEPMQKREKVFHNLNQSLKELNEEIGRKETEVGKTSTVLFDSSEFPEEDTETYFIIRR